MKKKQNDKDKGTLFIGFSPKDTLFPKMVDFTETRVLRGANFEEKKIFSSENTIFMDLLYIKEILKDMKKWKKINKKRLNDFLDILINELKKLGIKNYGEK